MMNITDLRISRIGIDEIHQLRDLGRKTFHDAFAADNEDRYMQEYMAAAFSYDQLKKEISDPDSRFYFALLDGKPVGYLKLNRGPAQTEPQDKDALEIERIYVLGDFQGRGVGQLLFDKALEVAERSKAKYLWLGVWEENEKAVRFYRKNGFEKFGTHIFKLGPDEQTDILMRRWMAGG